ncbi:MAG: hypothetical protein COA84_07315 [Robiginitomaculum sp.]|nr:MAG: hypothetical protein COA84_07315 [Robiginitomaculum sp.]
MRSVADLGKALDAPLPESDPAAAATFLLHTGEEILEHWLHAHDRAPTDEQKEGFRILALHRQGAKGDPSFNACRETARELVYHYNLVTLDPEHEEMPQRLAMMRLVANHLYLFVSGKMEVAGLGEFCCASKPIRLNSL